MIEEGYRIERGRLWPATDVGAAAVAFGDVADLEVAYRYCRGFGVAIQAGGCCGVWPADMARKFKVVYTFEPDPVNFRCLCANAPAENVFKFNAALGDRHCRVGLDLRPDNVGAHQVDGSGNIPTMTIDDLALEHCDLIYLDIEGSELAALRGAERTIAGCRPAIVVEDKGMSERYGIPVGEIERWLADRFEYRVAERVRRDVVLVP